MLMYLIFEAAQYQLGIEASQGFCRNNLLLKLD